MSILTDKIESEVKRRELNIKTDAELAEIIGIKPSAYSRLKSGERELTKGQARKVVKRFPDLYQDIVSLMFQDRNREGIMVRCEVFKDCDNKDCIHYEEHKPIESEHFDCTTERSSMSLWSFLLC